jgi:hypothetical protein
MTSWLPTNDPSQAETSSECKQWLGCDKERTEHKDIPCQMEEKKSVRMLFVLHKEGQSEEENFTRSSLPNLPLQRTTLQYSVPLATL